MIRIENGALVDPSQGIEGEFDLLIESGRIKALDRPGSLKQVSVSETFDAKGRVIFPGLIDVHVHLREPGFEHKETVASGTRAAILGGFTSVAPMANTSPVNDHPLITKAILEKASAAGQARVFPIGAVTKGQKGQELAEIGLMAKAGIRAISDDGMPVMNSALMRRAMEYARMFDLPVISHAEDLNLSSGGPMTEGAVSSLLGVSGNPNASEEIMVAREVSLCRLTGARVHIAHLSTREGLEIVKRAKESGLPITAEVTPHHLLLNENSWLSGRHSCAHHQFRADYKMAPPLRSERDQEALLQALNSGVIDLVASDHAPHGCVDKETEIELAANGILGLQTTLPILLGLVQAKKMKLSRMVESLTVSPAKLLGLQGLGSLKVGAHADLVVVDLNETWILTPDQLASKSANSPFAGRKFQGRVVRTMVGGEWK
ncbi:MAG: dihydroorotase [Bdellovibrionales bacterium]|nr:dihydroorotase [Bdellovibrionales bacterium]